MSVILAIDQSTSATKAVLFDAAGHVVGQSDREHRQIYPQPGWVEHDAEEIWQNVLAVLRRRRQPQPRSLALGRRLGDHQSARNHSSSSTSRPAGRCTMPSSGNAAAATKFAKQLRDAGHEETVQRKTGLKLDTYFSGSKLKWLIDQRPDIRQKLETGDALIGTIDTYLDLSPDRRQDIRHRPHQRQPHAAVRHRPTAMGRRTLLPCSTCQCARCQRCAKAARNSAEQALTEFCRSHFPSAA